MDPRELAASLVTSNPPTSPEETVKPETEPAPDAAELTEDIPVEEIAEETEEAPEEADESPDPDEDTTEEVITLKVEGEEIEVTFDELVQSYQIDGAAKKRLQEATEARQHAVDEGRAEGLQQAQTQVDERVTEVNQVREQLAQLVGIVGQQMFAPLVDRPDPVMEQTDPIGYLSSMERWREDQARIGGLQQQVTQITQAQRQEVEKQQQDVKSRNRDQLLAKRPELRQAEPQAAFTQNVRLAQQYAGFTNEEVNAFPDHRGLLILDKLGQYLAGETAQDPATPAQRVIAGVKKPLTPGAVTYKKTQRQKKRRADRDRAKQTGSVKDVAKLIME